MQTGCMEMSIANNSTVQCIQKILAWCYSFLQSHFCTCKSPIIREGRCNFFHSCQAIIGCKNCNTHLPRFKSITVVCLQVSLTPWYLDLLQTCLLFMGSIQLLSLMYKALFGLDPVYLWNYLSFVFFLQEFNWKFLSVLNTRHWCSLTFGCFMSFLSICCPYGFLVMFWVCLLVVFVFVLQHNIYRKSSDFFVWLTWRLPS